MAARYFKGTIDIDDLSPRELAQALGALAVLEEMAAEGAITFQVGVLRSRSDKRRDRAIQPQQAKIIDLMQDGQWRSVREVVEATGIGENSVSAQLSVLTARGVIEKGQRPVEGWSSSRRGRKIVNIYRAATKG